MLIKEKKKVLVIGGCGRIGASVAQDILTHTNSQVIVTSRKPQTVTAPLKFLALDLEDPAALKNAAREADLFEIASVDLVIHCAGPFHYREGTVLKTCIDLGVNYLDVSDHQQINLVGLVWLCKQKSPELKLVEKINIAPPWFIMIPRSRREQAPEALLNYSSKAN